MWLRTCLLCNTYSFEDSRCSIDQCLLDSGWMWQQEQLFRRNVQHVVTVICILCLFGMGMGTALLIMMLYFHQLKVYHPPDSEFTVSAFLSLGYSSPSQFLWQLLIDELSVCKAMTILQLHFGFCWSVACALGVVYTTVELPESLHQHQTASNCININLARVC